MRSTGWAQLVQSKCCDDEKKVEKEPSWAAMAAMLLARSGDKSTEISEMSSGCTRYLMIPLLVDDLTII